MLCRCGLKGNQAEYSALKDAMVPKGSRGLTYFDLKNFLQSYSHTTTETKRESGNGESPLDSSAYEEKSHPAEVIRVHGISHHYSCSQRVSADVVL